MINPIFTTWHTLFQQISIRLWSLIIYYIKIQLHIVFGQIHGYAGVSNVSVFQVTIEADGKVKAADENHSRVENAIPSSKILCRSHVVM